MLESARLILLPLGYQELKLLKKGRSSLEQHLNLNPNEFQISAEISNELSEALNFWLVKVLRYPDEFQWYTNWEIILKSLNISIGGIGFSGFPDSDGSTSIGFMIDVKYQKQGYCTEAVSVLTNWAFNSPDCVKIHAQTLPENVASQKVLTKNGFQFYKEENKVMDWIKIRP
jgi:[ribosomal protein S5]-alanine N-acetyltransferase